MHHRTLLAQAEARRHRQHDSHRLDDQRPLAQVAANDKTRENRFDLGNTRAARVRREVLHQQGRQGGEEHRPADVEQIRHDVSAEAVLGVDHKLRPGEPLKES